MVSSAYAGQRGATAGHTSADQPHLSFGVLYQQDDLIAVIDDYQQAVLGARALLDGGVPADRLHVCSGSAFVRQLTAAKRRRGCFGRFGACLARVFSDDADCEQALLDEARQNHSLLVIHAVDAATAARLSGTLRAFGAHTMRYYRPGSIEDLI